MIINNLNLHRLSPNSFSSSPVCKLLSVWVDYGEFTVGLHQLAMPPPKQGHLISTQRAHHMPH